MNEALGQEATAKAAEVEVAPVVAEALDNAAEWRSGSEAHQPPEPTRGAVCSSSTTDRYYAGHCSSQFGSHSWKKMASSGVLLQMITPRLASCNACDRMAPRSSPSPGTPFGGSTITRALLTT